MGEKNIVICDREYRYAHGLMEHIADHKEFAVRTSLCTSWEYVEDFSRNNPIHILIVDENCTYEQRRAVGAQQVFVLVTGNAQGVHEEENAVYKYQSVDCILTQIFETYFANTKENMMKSVRRETAKLLTVYSPIHRCGKTYFALSLGKTLAHRRKVLYLNLEGYAGMTDIFEQQGEDNLADALYYMRQEQGDFQIRLGMMVKTLDELDYILPMNIWQDLCEVTKEEWEHFFQSMIQNSMYDVIVLDLGECVQGLHRILELSDFIYTPILEDMNSRAKLLQYEENLKTLHQTELLQKSERFIVPQNTEKFHILMGTLLEDLGNAVRGII